MDMLETLGGSGILDVLLTALVIYSVLVWFKKTQAAFVFTGIVIVFSGLYLLGREFNLALTSALLEQFFAVILISMVVIFRDEVRRFFERVALWSFRHWRSRGQSFRLTRPEVEVLVQTAFELAKGRIGALIAIQGRDPLNRHVENGTLLEGKLSEPLLKSLFDPHSTGHDGAVLLEGDRVTRFGCFLPLSRNTERLLGRGTRHAAGLGLADVTDALCLVISEERGTVSVAREGRLELAGDSIALAKTLERFYQDLHPQKQRRGPLRLMLTNWKEKVIAVALAFAMWFVVVHGGTSTFRTYTLPVNFEPLPGQWQIQDIAPREVKVTLLGPQRAFYLLPPWQINLTIRIDEDEVREGVQSIRVSPVDVNCPRNLRVQLVDPPKIRVNLIRKK